MNLFITLLQTDSGIVMLENYNKIAITFGLVFIFLMILKRNKYKMGQFQAAIIGAIVGSFTVLTFVHFFGNEYRTIPLFIYLLSALFAFAYFFYNPDLDDD